MDLKRFGFRPDFDEDNKIVKQEDFEFEGKQFYASTVDLGLNHQYGSGPPLWYETMIFPKGEWAEMYGNRYTTREDALKGHEELVADISEGKYTIENGWFELKDIDSTEQA